ncbi:MAG: VOC family protein [Alphaproteobacteria bacterium]
MASHGHFHWNELMSWDAEKATQFYTKTLGWQFDAMPGPNNTTYYVAKDGDKPIGGIFSLNKEEHGDVPENWFAYIAVDNVDARVEKVSAAGGKVLRPPFDLENIGRIAIVLDAGGAAFGLITPADSFSSP